MRRVSVDELEFFLADLEKVKGLHNNLENNSRLFIPIEDECLTESDNGVILLETNRNVGSSAGYEPGIFYTSSNDYNFGYAKINFAYKLNVNLFEKFQVLSGKEVDLSVLKPYDCFLVQNEYVLFEIKK